MKTPRRRLRGKTDKGTDIAIALERSEVGRWAVLLLDARAMVLRVAQQHWLRITPRDVDAALEAAIAPEIIIGG